MKEEPKQRLSEGDRESRLAPNIWKSYGGSALFTVVIFVLIVTAHLGLDVERLELETEEVHLYLPPPPPLPAVTRQSHSIVSRTPAPSDLEFPEETDSLSVEPIEHLPLNLLNVSLDSELEPVIYNDFDLRLKLQALNLHPTDRLIIYGRDQVDEKPVRIYTPPFSKSLELLRDSAPGTWDEEIELLVLYHITRKGRPEDIYILESSNSEANRQAVEIISLSRFRPARRNGKPVDVWVQHGMLFE